MKQQIWKNYFDVVILPPKDISDYARKLSKEYARYGTKWTLGKRSFIPHISLYHIPVKPKDFDAFVSEVKHSIKDFEPGHLRTTVIELNQLTFNKPKWLSALYLKIIKKTLKYLDKNYKVEDTWPLEKFPKWMRKAGIRFIKKYGTPAVGRNFRPHVTLTSFKGSKPKFPMRRAKALKFKPEYLYICELGPSHSCQRIVKKIVFGKA